MKIFLPFLFCIIPSILSYKIFLYSPRWGQSHVKFMGRIADILVKAGHDVTVYEPLVDKGCLLNGTKLAKVVFRDDKTSQLDLLGEDMQRDIWSGDIEGFFAAMDKFKAIRLGFANNCKNQLNDDPLMDSFKAQKFDIALGEHFDICYYGLLKRIEIENYITISSGIIMDNAASILGLPMVPSFLPNFSTRSKPTMTYFERAINLLQTGISLNFLNVVFGQESNDIMKKKFGKDFDIDKQLSKSAYYFANVDEHIAFPRPISHKIVCIGGFGKVQARPLEKNFEQIMQNSKKGVVYISFGTVAMSYMMPQEIKAIFLETFKKFPDVTFLWKYEKDEHKIAEGIPNVVTSKWVPQNDLLEHPKLLAFISHGGMNSVQEGASKGVPMIVIPLYADQYHNAKMLEYRKMAIALDRKLLSVDILSNAIKTIIEDPRYHKEAKRLGEIVASKPESADDRLVKYTEFAAKYGPNLNLDMEGGNLNFVEFYCMDIIIPFLGLVFAILYVVFRLVRVLLNNVFTVLSSDKLKSE